MQGGLLTSVIANQKEQEHDEIVDEKQGRKTRKKNFALKSFDQLDWMPVGMFLLAKLVAYTILGFLLGMLGSTITLSLGVRLAFQIFTALFMFATAMNLLDVHPIFRFVVFQPPKFIQRMVHNSSKSKVLFAPAVLGFMTIFIPCGVTQAMEVLAISSGSPITGALIMFSFVIGTSPLFAILGVAAAKLSEGWYNKFTKIAAYALIAMTAYGVNGVLLVLDSPITVNRIVRPITYFFSDERFANSNVAASNIVDGVQQLHIDIKNNGYVPNYLQVKSGVPVELTLQSDGVYSCALSFILREFDINAYLKATDKQTFSFTPTKPGKYTFACSMGMYAGTLEVIK